MKKKTYRRHQRETQGGVRTKFAKKGKGKVDYEKVFKSPHKGEGESITHWGGENGVPSPYILGSLLKKGGLPFPPRHEGGVAKGKRKKEANLRHGREEEKSLYHFLGGGRLLFGVKKSVQKGWTPNSREDRNSGDP